MNTQPGSHFKKHLPLIIVALFVGIVGCIILLQSYAAVPNPPSVYLTPENTANGPGKQVRIQVRENSGTTAINATEVAITYPANLIEFNSFDDNGSLFLTKPDPVITSGKVVLSRGINAGTSNLTGDQLITTLVFTTKTSSGTANLAIVANETSVLNATTYQNIITGSGRTQGANVVVDATPPTVSVTGISNNQVLSSNSTVPININTTDATGATRLDIRIDGKTVLAPNITSPTYVFQWNTTGLSIGNHTIQVLASDSYGNTGQSAVTTVSIADKTPPTVTLTVPSSPLKGVVTLSATASDSGGSGLNRVEFYAGSTLIGSDNTSPYQVSWNTNDGKYADGSYSITAKAYDNANPSNTSTSTPSNVTVQNTDKTPPSAPTNLNVKSVTMNSVNLAWNASSDNVGVTGYQVSRNGTVINTVAGTSFTDNNLTPGTSYSYSVVAIDAGGNKSAQVSVNATTLAQKIGDFNQDGKVYLDDLAGLLANWKKANPLYDLDKKGSVDIVDLAIFLANYGK